MGVVYVCIHTYTHTHAGRREQEMGWLGVKAGEAGRYVEEGGGASSIDMYNNDVGKESAQKFMKQTGDLKAATLYFAS